MKYHSRASLRFDIYMSLGGWLFAMGLGVYVGYEVMRLWGYDYAIAC